jgi:solute carrier family 8 (sodium/calcium exchanger)
MAPKYCKRALLATIVGAIGVYCFAYLQEPDVSYPGRELQATRICNGDSILPIIPYENTWELPTRAVLYVLFLGWLFLGVAISADCFMASIEIITAETSTVHVEGKDVEVEVWNSTVANLTLMALGSSAPEILLAVVETVSLKFESGDLGPGTIVGSAAFNLLFITAICISCLDEDKDDPTQLETREIEEFGVFIITAIASLWAYFWMIIALAWVSADQIDPWEAVVTLLMFPVLVWVSWAEDQAWWGWFGSAAVSPEGDDEAGPHSEAHLKSIDGTKVRRKSEAGSVEEALEASGDMDPAAAAAAAAKAEFKKKKKSRLAYRIQATRQMSGAKRILPTDGKKEEIIEETEDKGPPTTIDIGFEKAKIEVDESCGDCPIKIVRSGILDKPCSVSFDTSDGDAHAGDDYVSLAGNVKFEAGETEKEIKVQIIDDNEWAPDKHFYVRLFAATAEGEEPKTKVVTSTVEITILNDDDPGTISMKEKMFRAIKGKETVQIPVERKDGYDGNVLVFVKTIDGDAVAGVDYEALSEEYEMHFAHTVREQFLEINLINNPEKESCNFSVEITAVEPEGAKIGEQASTLVAITNDPEYEKVMKEVTELMQDEMEKYGVGTSSWGEQLHNAMNMEGDGDDFECSDYFFHFLSFYWKVFHAMVPPTDYGGGWATFWVSLAFIGLITAFVGDCAKMLGCVIGLKDSVTAITFVALGTSLPDTFASMQRGEIWAVHRGALGFPCHLKAQGGRYYVHMNMHKWDGSAEQRRGVLASIGYPDTG